MGEQLTGSCLCGKIKYTVDLQVPAEELSSDFCHCTMCRKSSGSVEGSFFAVPKSTVTFNEIPKKYESSKGVYRSFCPDCGSSMSYENTKNDTIDLTIGTLEEPEKIKPKYHLWVENKILWNHDIPKYLQSQPK